MTIRTGYWKEEQELDTRRSGSVNQKKRHSVLQKGMYMEELQHARALSPAYKIPIGALSVRLSLTTHDKKRINYNVNIIK